MTDPSDFYDPFYAQGGFGYDHAKELRFAREVLIPLAGWKQGDRVIEIGAGMGHHADILRTEGFDVTAVELSKQGTDQARTLYPDLDVVNASADAWEPERKGHVFARGMSWYHYELDGISSRGVNVPEQTARIMDAYVAPGHSFVLQIVTDLSGNRPSEKVHMNRVGDYLDLFQPLGSVRAYDWAGAWLSWHSRRAHRGVIVVTTRADWMEGSGGKQT